jgi:predicted nucleic acid-binding protein
MSLLDAIAPGSTVTVDTSPIIYMLEGHPVLAQRFAPLFEAVESGRNQIMISVITIAEVLAGPLQKGREGLARRYRQVMTTSPGWSVMAIDADLAEGAARFRARYRLQLPDAILLATAIESGSAALVTHDRDFSRIKDLPVLTAQ